MAVLWCREKYGNEGEFDLRAEGSKYRRTFLAYTDSPQNDREATIWNSPAVQAKAELFKPWEAGHDLDPSSYAVRVRVASLEEHPNLYEIEVNYEPPEVQDTNGSADDPFSEPWDVEWTWASAKRGLWLWYSRAPASKNLSEFDIEEQRYRLGVLNSAKEPLDPQPEVDDDRLVLTITRNEPVFFPSVAIVYANVTNSDHFSGARPGQLLMKPWRAKRLFKANRFYYSVTYEMHYRKEGWNLKLIDIGSYYWEGGYETGGDKKMFLADGHPTTGLLQSNGDKLPPGQPPQIIGGEQGMAIYGFAPFQPLFRGI